MAGLFYDIGYIIGRTLVGGISAGTATVAGVADAVIPPVLHLLSLLLVVLLVLFAIALTWVHYNYR
jgi:hypothetical protein